MSTSEKPVEEDEGRPVKLIGLLVVVITIAITVLMGFQIFGDAFNSTPSSQSGISASKVVLWIANPIGMAGFYLTSILGATFTVSGIVFSIGMLMSAYFWARIAGLPSKESH